MIRYSLAVMAAVVWVTSEAAAIECAAEPLASGKGHWSWRMIDGRKCWYPGRPGMSKDKLHWPAQTVAQRGGHDPADARAAAAAADTPSAAVQPAPDEAQPERVLTFRERWPHWPVPGRPGT